MITVKNLTTQGRELIFRDGNAYIHYWLKGYESVAMPNDFITDTVNELARRKILKLTNS